MTLLFVLFIVFVPIFMGMFVRKLLEYKGQNLADDYLCGILILIVVSGIVQFVTVTFNYSFTWYCRTLLLASIFMAVIGLVLSIALQTYTLQTLKQSVKDKVKNINRSNNVWGLVVIGLVFLGVLARILFSSPVLEGDFTLETINTTLSTNTIYKYNSLTGQEILNGMPIRQQILTLPMLLAFFIDTFGMDTSVFVFRIFPCAVALMCFLAYYRMGQNFFPDNFEKRSHFLHILSLMILVGDCGIKSPTFLLVFQGFSGYCFLACVLLPYLFTACLRRKWGIAALCVSAEIFLVWTTYGIGFSVIMIALFIVSILVRNIIRNAPAKTKEQASKG